MIAILLIIIISNASGYRLKRQTYADIVDDYEIVTRIYNSNIPISDEPVSSEISVSSEDSNSVYEDIFEILKRDKVFEDDVNRRIIRNVKFEDKSFEIVNVLDDLNVAETHIFRPIFRYKSRILEKRKI